MNEELLLAAWLNMSLSIKGDRILKDISFNEASIFNVLTKAKDNKLSFKEISLKTKILKSQLTRILSDMVDKDYLTCKVCRKDRRTIYYTINPQNEMYKKEHAKILELMAAVCARLGEQKTIELSKLLDEATEVVNEFMKNKKK